MEWTTGIEPASSAWKAEALPLDDIHKWQPLSESNTHHLIQSQAFYRLTKGQSRVRGLNP